MSFNIATFPVSETIKLVATYLEELTACNDSLDQIGSTPFHAQTIPNIEILPYLLRIQKYCPISNECFLSIIVYMHRLMRANCSRGKEYEETSTVDSYSVHRLLLTGILTTSKFFSDVFFTNTRYAKVGGIQLAELNKLELHFLTSLEFKLSVSIPELQYYGDQLLQQTLPYNPPEEDAWLNLSATTSDPELPLLSSSSSSTTDTSINTTMDSNLPSTGSVSSPLTSPTLPCPPWSLHRLSTDNLLTPPSSSSSSTTTVSSASSDRLKSKPSSFTTTTLVSGLLPTTSCSSYHHPTKSNTTSLLLSFTHTYAEHFNHPTTGYHRRSS